MYSQSCPLQPILISTANLAICTCTANLALYSQSCSLQPILLSTANLALCSWSCSLYMYSQSCPLQPILLSTANLAICTCTANLALYPSQSCSLYTYTANLSLCTANPAHFPYTAYSLWYCTYSYVYMDDSACFVQKSEDFWPPANFQFFWRKLQVCRQYTVKMVSGFPVPSRDVTYQTFPKESGKWHPGWGRENR